MNTLTNDSCLSITSFPPNLGKKLTPKDVYKTFVRICPHRCNTEEPIDDWSYIPEKSLESLKEKEIFLVRVSPKGKLLFFKDIEFIKTGSKEKWNDGRWASTDEVAQYILNGKEKITQEEQIEHLERSPRHFTFISDFFEKILADGTRINTLLGLRSFPKNLGQPLTHEDIDKIFVRIYPRMGKKEIDWLYLPEKNLDSLKEEELLLKSISPEGKLHFFAINSITEYETSFSSNWNDGYWAISDKVAKYILGNKEKIKQEEEELERVREEESF